MPCCIAVVQFSQCQHSLLFLLGCTSPACQELCPKEQRELLVQTQFKWMCDACHRRRSSSEAKAKIQEWNKRKRKLSQDATLAMHDRESRMQALRRREEYLAQLLGQQHAKQLKEIEAAEHWTWQYGRAGFVARYWKSAGSGKQSLDEQVQVQRDIWEKALGFMTRLRCTRQLDLAVVVDAMRGLGKPQDEGYARRE
ncbi:hypothetical protein CDD81_5992 [Ophiocordyceps australis]|uniref:Uncharacterized protein n=1 Tax=Ophiocordyceps australis TaxID=1399860 RepID=A0A2C5Y931_9HYPO|nr:hypothetical protein CDD81_5992 [Ophiocordyceps australis]